MNLNLSFLMPELFLTALAVIMIVIDLLTPHDDKRGLGAIGIGGMLFLIPLIAFLSPEGGLALSGMFILDTTSRYFKLLIVMTTVLVFFMAMLQGDRIKEWQGEFYILILFAALGMMFMASSADFVSLYVSIELTTITFYILSAYMRKELASTEAGLKFLVTGGLASGFLLYGISFIYGSTGSTNFVEIASTIQGNEGINTILTLGIILTVIGLTFKVASIPFHVWVPDVYEGAPSPITALLAAASKAAGFVVLIRVLFTVLNGARDHWVLLIAFLAALTLIFGNMAAMPQKNIKRLLGYAGIGSAGYILMGIASASVLGVGAIMYYLLTYVFAILGAFLVIVIFYNSTNSDQINDYDGLSKRSPLLAATMFIALFSLAGIPPLGGFIAKFYIFAAVIREGIIWLAVIGLVMVIVAMYYFLLVIKRIYLREAVTDEPIVMAPLTKGVLYLVNAVTIILGVYPGPFTEWFLKTARTLF
jgi:NADH-quinone oxidoreductase subunit N